MRMIVLNASPKGNSSQCNSKIICEEFVSGMKSPCEIRCIADSDAEELAGYVQSFDTVIIVLPLYIHAMPGIMMNFIEHMKPSARNGQALGFIVQAGFIETKQEKYVERYFSALAKQLNYHYLGTVSKGEAAAIYMFPKMFRKVLKRIRGLGRCFEETHSFDTRIVEQLGKPYELSRFKARVFQLCCDMGLNDFGWHRVLKKNKAFDRRLDRPFLY